MKKKAVILIDGENFRYSLKSLFPGRFKYLPKKVDYIPAIQAYKDSGKHIFSVNFETANKRLLPGGSYMLSGLVDKVVTIGQENILAHIKEF